MQGTNWIVKRGSSDGVHKFYDYKFIPGKMVPFVASAKR